MTIIVLKKHSEWIWNLNDWLEMKLKWTWNDIDMKVKWHWNKIAVEMTFKLKWNEWNEWMTVNGWIWHEIRMNGHEAKWREPKWTEMTYNEWPKKV